MRKIKVAARESRLSQLQVKEAFSHYPNLEYELCLLSSFGDKHKSISLLDGEAPADIFTRELDRALLDGNADVAVHSAKDLPYPLNPELEVVALFPAFDTTDSLVSRDHLRLCDLPSGSTIGTSSPLRKRGLETLRSDLSVVGIRGTIEERVRQVREGKIDAAIVATCALKRLGMEEEVSEVLPFATHPLQGFLAITARRGNEELHQLFADGNLLKRQGRVKLVGFGPGNPDLLTMAAVKALDEADVIFYDDLIGKDYLSRLSAEKIYVGKRSGSHHTEQDDINRMLLDAARCGKQVVRLKGGDPMMFAHASEEIAFLESNLVDVIVIPGITTASAFAADVKVSLTHRLLSSSVAFVSGHSSEPETPNAETLVYYMGAAHLKMIARRLLEQGHPADTTVLLGYNVSLSDEQFFTTTLQLLSTSDHRYPTPLIAMIGDVAALRRHKAEEIQRVLYTGTVCNTPHTLHTPLIEIAPMADRSGIVSSVRHLHEYDYLLFTSRYAVKYWFEALHSENLDTKYLKGVTIISIGDITSQALRDEGVKQILQTEQEDSCGIIELFRPLETGKVLIPRSDLALQIIPDGLRKLGYEVTTVTAYHNRCPEHPLKANLKHIRKIIFTSPSTVDNFIRVYDSLPDGIPMETRGRTTEEHLKAKQYSNEKI